MNLNIKYGTIQLITKTVRFFTSILTQYGPILNKMERDMAAVTYIDKMFLCRDLEILCSKGTFEWVLPAEGWNFWRFCMITTQENQSYDRVQFWNHFDVTSNIEVLLKSIDIFENFKVLQA